MADQIQLIAGLGNPGSEYESTRHNAGAWYVQALARAHGVTLSRDKRFPAMTGQLPGPKGSVRLLIPTTFMNRSGQATAALANFYRIPVTEMLVAHDELDLPPGAIRLKQGGGHGGHNGLRDIISHHANQRDFLRLRIGIGHPGHASEVTSHVLSRPSPGERQLMEAAIDAALAETNALLAGDYPQIMNRLNGFLAKAPS